MGLLQYTISFVFIGLFIIAIMGFATNFASDNNAFLNIADDPNLGPAENDMKIQMERFSDSADSTYKGISDNSVIGGAQTLVSAGTLTLAVPSLISSSLIVMNSSRSIIFGNDEGMSIFFTLFMGILLFIFAMYVYKAWVGRVPD